MLANLDAARQRAEAALKRDQYDQTFLILMDIDSLPGGVRQLRVACRPRDGYEVGDRGFEDGWVTLVDPILLTRIGCCGIDHFEQEAMPITTARDVLALCERTERAERIVAAAQLLIEVCDVYEERASFHFPDIKACFDDLRRAVSSAKEAGDAE
jgi:hypothetical protein